MVDWFWRRRKGGQLPRLRAREEAQPATRLDLREFAPAPVEFLARAAYVELAIFEGVARAVSIAPSTGSKAALAQAAAATARRHRMLAIELGRLGEDPGEAMDHYRAVPDRFQRLTQGGDWVEATLTTHLAIGFLDELFLALAEGLPAQEAEGVRSAFADRASDPLLAELLVRAMEENPRLPARLALWGRRVLGDILLVARDALRSDAGPGGEGARNEPAFNELIANHTRRMDALGLSA